MQKRTKWKLHCIKGKIMIKVIKKLLRSSSWASLFFFLFLRASSWEIKVTSHHSLVVPLTTCSGALRQGDASDPMLRHQVDVCIYIPSFLLGKRLLIQLKSHCFLCHLWAFITMFFLSLLLELQLVIVQWFAWSLVARG